MKFPRRTQIALAAVLLALPGLSCGTAGETAPDASTEGPQSPPSAVNSPDELPEGLPRFVAQEGWIAEAPKSTFRSVQYRLPGEADAGDAEIYVSPFPNGVGSLESNLDRWVGQVGLTTPAALLPAEQRWTEEVRSFQVTTIYVKGQMAAMQGMSPDTPTVEDAALIASFVERVGAPSVWTIKAQGPAATIALHEDAIKAFIRGL